MGNTAKPSFAKALLALAVAGASELTFAQTLEEVIVTATRREANVFDVPVAVSAYSGEALKAASVDNLGDLNTLNTSFMATPYLSDPIGNAPIRIRGIGTGGGNPGFEGAVGLYVDDVYRSRTGSAMLTFFDMAGVEILRGPQGTLFGKNTTAGAVLQKTAPPVLGENSAGLTLEAGNYGQQMIEAYGNFALGDNTAIRIAGVMDEEDGWFEHPVTGKDTFWRDNEALRGSILFEPSDTFRGRITLDWSTMESPGNYGTSTRLNDDDPTGLQNGLFGPLALNLIPGFPGGEGYWYWDLETGEGLDPYSRDIAVKSGQEYELEQYGLTAHFDWELSDTLTLRSITGYREIDSGSEGGDWDFGAVALAGLLNQFYDFETFSQEFLLEGDFDLAGESALSMVAGINYFTEDMDYLRQATVGDQFGFYLGNAWNGAFTPLGGGVNEFSGCDLANPFCVPLGAIGNPDFKFQDVEFAQTEDAIGLFLHLTYDINEQFSIIGGVRYTEVEKDAEVDNRVGANQDEYYDLVQQNQLGFFLAGAALMSPDWEADRKDDEWTYLGTLQYRPNDNMQLYASYSRGFKSGGFNFNEDAVGGTPSLTGTPDANFRFYSPLDFNGSEFDPEEVDAYELGWRWDINGAARLSVTLFKSEYEDLQVASFTGLKFVVFNAGSSDTEGVEIEADWAVTDNLTLTAAGTFLDATYGDDVEGLPAGRERGQTPDEALYFGARYTYPISSSLELYVNANYSYYSEMYLAEGTDEPLRSVTQDSYDLVSATLGIRNPGSWDLSAFCDNCFDEDYYEWAFNQPFQDAIAVNPAPPNLYGARFTIYF